MAEVRKLSSLYLQSAVRSFLGEVSGWGRLGGQQPKTELIQKTRGAFGVHSVAPKGTFCTQ